MAARTNVNDPLIQAVLDAGGRREHIELFDMLRKRTFILERDSMGRREELPLFDLRTGQSCLFMFPPYIQIPLAVIFRDEVFSV